MGIMNFLKNQAIEVIEWTDNSGDTLVYRFPVHQNEIKMKAKLTVREGQNAVFVSQGQIADVFKPGMYTLETQNIPILTKILSLPYGFNSPFKAEVYFVSTRQFTDQKWGTNNPVMLRDKEFGMIRLRGFGIYSIKVVDPAVFMKEIVGTDGHFTTDEITGQLKRTAVSGFSDFVATAGIPALDLATHYDELGAGVKEKLQPEFKNYGLELVKFIVENLSLPEEVEKMIDKRTQMGVVGNLQQYTQFQTAQAIEEAAKNPGGMAGMGPAMGAGFAMAQQMAQSMNAANQPPAPAAAPAAAAGAKFCGECGGALPAEGKFCPNCGKPRG
ncbi:MAG TPA: SPFH domain-containing protein [bacterium]|nr:SPFH domain-containing protein [bacterium]